MLLAAIDIGSNAARLLFANAYKSKNLIHVEKASLIRIPTRLGEDVYESGKISEDKATDFIKTIKAYKLLIDVYKPFDYDICATAAMREASNSEEILKKIKKETGLKIKIIDGMEEARIIRTTSTVAVEPNMLLSAYVDVGGGSTEISIVNSEGKVLKARSFRVGTIRMLNEKVREGLWEDMHEWLSEFKPFFGKIQIIGSGGNINKLTKLYGNHAQQYISLTQLQAAKAHLNSFSLEQRIEELGLRPDRADVIVPAATIFEYIMKTIDASNVLAPKIGLADGLIHTLYQKHNDHLETPYGIKKKK